MGWAERFLLGETGQAPSDKNMEGKMLILVSISSWFRNSIALLVMAAALPALSACSVGMAMSGEEDPNVSVVQSGSTRLDVERELGAPHSSRVLDDNGLEAIYRYELGNEPSTGRAIAWGALDVLTLGLWEVIGTPVEGSQGEEYEAVIVYNADGIVQSVATDELEKDDEEPEEDKPEPKNWAAPAE